MKLSEFIRNRNSYNFEEYILPKIEQLEKDNEELLDIVIKYTKSLQEVDGNFENNSIVAIALPLIEKIKGKKWEDI